MSLKPMSPRLQDQLHEAVKTGCFHCVVSVLSANELENGEEFVDVIGNLLQVAAEICVDARSDAEETISLLKRLIEESKASRDDGSEPRHS